MDIRQTDIPTDRQTKKLRPKHVNFCTRNQLQFAYMLTRDVTALEVFVSMSILDKQELGTRRL